MHNLRRTDSVLTASFSSANSSSSSPYSRFSFASWRSSSSTSSRSVPEKANAVSRPSTPKKSNTVNAKLVFGLSGSNCKPGLLFTQSNGIPKTARLVFLPLARSFKNDYIDLPSTILTQLVSVFSEAKAKIPPSSKFAATFSDRNLRRLQDLLEKAKSWEKCGQVTSKFLIGTKIHVVGVAGENDLVERLLQQPNIFEILKEAIEILACTGLDIPAPSARASLPKPGTAKKPGSINSSSSFQLRSFSPSPLYDDCQPRTEELHSTLRQLSQSDSIISLELGELDRLTDELTTIHIPLYAWYAPYEDQEQLADLISSSLEECFASNKEIGTPTEIDGMCVSGSDVAIEWAKAAKELKAREQEFNLWCLALQRCRRVKAAFPN